MTHTHACLQEEEEDSSMSGDEQAFYDYEEDDLREIVSAL